MIIPTSYTTAINLFQKIKSTGEISYITEVHPTGRAIKLAFHIEKL